MKTKRFLSLILSVLLLLTSLPIMTLSAAATDPREAIASYNGAEQYVFFRGAQRSSNATDKYSIRLIAEINKQQIIADSTYAGFDVTVNGNTQHIPVSKYYTKLLAQNGDEEGMSEIVPTSGERVLIALVIENIPEGQTVDFYVSPYYKLDGDSVRRLGEKAVVRLNEGALQCVKFTDIRILPEEYISDVGHKYKTLTVGGEETLRGRFGRYTWLPDESGFICGTADGSFYYYNVSEEKLIFLDQAIPAIGALATYVNPVDGWVYYHQSTGLNCTKLLRVNPKTLERELLYTTTDSNMKLGIEVTNDGNYVHYVMGGERELAAGETIEFGVIELSTATAIYTQSYTAEGTELVNGFALNPQYPRLILFCNNAPNQSLKLMDMTTGDLTCYSQIAYEQPENAGGFADVNSFMWTRDGENISLSDASVENGTSLTLTDKEFNVVSREFAVDGDVSFGNNVMVDSALKWAACGSSNGAAVIELDNNSSTKEITVMISDESNPANVEITASGRYIAWTNTRGDDALEIAWAINPYTNNMFIDNVGVGEFSLLNTSGADIKSLQTFFEDEIGIKMNIDNTPMTNSHYIILELSPSITYQAEIRVENGNLILCGDWANYKDLITYFAEVYMPSFESENISLTDADNIEIAITELWTALGKEVPTYQGDKTQMLRIHCYGDSVTEGVQLEGQFTADYGKDTYPARLTTMLEDGGYNVLIKNYGVAGETLADVCIRSGALTAYTTEEIILPKERGLVSLGDRLSSDGTKLYIPKESANLSTDRFVHFMEVLRESNNVNYVKFGGVNQDCEIAGMPGNGKNEKGVRTRYSRNYDVTIPKDSPLILPKKADANLNIFYAGFNDGTRLTLSDFVNMYQKCADVSGGEYIVIGCHRPIWRESDTRHWNGMTGTDAQKDAAYKKACYDAFGYRFIDLYEEFPAKAVDIALELGLFSNKSSQEIQTMRDKLANHILPAEFSQSGRDGDIHLSEIGCAVLAKIIAERMAMLGYI